jgi:RNA polymerase sigma-70 factor (ECF subfamily)
MTVCGGVQASVAHLAPRVRSLSDAYATIVTMSTEIAVTTDTTFEEIASAYQDQLRLHCYRMLGSLHDAEDATQEALLSAWKALPGFEGRSSLSTWLHAIATNTCLALIKKNNRTTQRLGSRVVDGDLAGEVPWMTPLPTQLIPMGSVPTPESAYDAIEGTRLAFVAAAQLLPPRQRAALILKDVLGWAVADVAHAIDASVPAVNSALQRARATLAGRIPALDPAPQAQRVADQWLAYWEKADMAGLASLLADDARMTMPPDVDVFIGPAAIIEFLRGVVFASPEHPYVLRPTGLNGVPGFAVYAPMPDGSHTAFGAMGVEVVAGKIAWLAGYPQPELLSAMGYPTSLEH